MNQDSLMTLVLQASPIQLRRANKTYQAFESQFWLEHDLTRLYNELSTQVDDRKGAAVIFEAERICKFKKARCCGGHVSDRRFLRTLYWFIWNGMGGDGCFFIFG